MATKDILDIKQEILIFLRNSDLISTSIRGVTTSQDTGTFAAANSHTLQTNPALVKNVRDITIGGSSLSFGTDYFIDYTAGIISFNSAQTGAYIINYDQGNTDRIFPDFPQPTLKLSQYPRIAIDIISGITTEFELGAETTMTEYIVQVNIYDRSQSNVENMIASLRNIIIANKKNFFYFPFITLTGLGPLLVSPNGEQKIVQRNQDFLIRFIYEN